MRRTIIAFILFSIGVGTSFAAAPTAEPARTAGDIRGTVNICQLLGIDRVTAYIPGHSYMARPAADGSLEFSFVPPGTYEIAFEASGGETVSTLSGVVVVAKQRTELGEISICIDADNDGFDATLDCNDANENIYPGAPEVCNLIDDDCDTTIDEDSPKSIFYRDSDYDTWGDANITEEACKKPVGYAVRSGDCYDQNHEAYPGSISFFSVDRGDGSFDYNCDDSEEKRYHDGAYCVVDVPGYPNGTCKTLGTGFWVSSSDALDFEPDCGVTASQHLGCRREFAGPFGITLYCRNRGGSAPQRCK